MELHTSIKKHKTGPAPRSEQHFNPRPRKGKGPQPYCPAWRT